MRAGNLRERITFQEVTYTPVTGYNDAEAWENVVEVWASVVATGGSERLKAQQIQEDTKYVIEVRHRDDIDGKNRILWGSKTLDIISAVADPRKTKLVIQAKETE